MPIYTLSDGTEVEVSENPSPEELRGLQRLEEDVRRTEARGKLKKAGEWALEGGKALARGAGTALSSLAEGAAAFNYVDRMGRTPEPGREMTQAVTSAIPVKPDETTGERYFRKGMEGVGGAVAIPGGGVRGLASGFLGGVGGELGRNVTGSPIGELLGATLGGSLGAIGAHAKTNAPALAQEGLEGVNPIHLKMAEEVQRRARALGFPEGALPNASQAMPVASNIDDLVDRLAQSRYGDKTIAGLRLQPEILRLRAPMEVSKLPGTATTTQDIANRAQVAATKALEATRRRANAAYTAALPKGAQTPPAAIAAFDAQLEQIARQNPNNQTLQGMIAEVRNRLFTQTQATPASKILGSGGQPLVPAGEPQKQWLTNFEQLKGAVDDAIQSYGRNTLATGAAPADMNRYAQMIRGAWKSTVRPSTPGAEKAAAAARSIYETEFEPMKKSVTGRIAGAQGASDTKEAVDKLTAVFKKGTPSSKYSEILTLEKDFRKVDPELFPDAVKTYLTEAVDGALKSTTNRTPAELAANLKRALYGTPAQQRGLNDMLAGVARSRGLPEEELVRGFKGFMEMVSHYARRPNMISGLPFSQIEEVAGKSAVGSGIKLGYLTQTGNRIQAFFSGRAYATIDPLLNSPEGLQLLRTLANKSIMSPQAQNAFGAFMGASVASQTPDQGTDIPQ